MDPDEVDLGICPSSNNSLQEKCALDAQWYYFVATSMGILFGGGLVISLLQLVYDKWNEVRCGPSGLIPKSDYSYSKYF